jgi:hypothetical protein
VFIRVSPSFWNCAQDPERGFACGDSHVQTNEI